MPKDEFGHIYPQKCVGCLHRRRIINMGIACCYLLDEGKARLCKPEDCTHYEPMTKERLKEVRNSINDEPIMRTKYEYF